MWLRKFYVKFKRSVKLLPKNYGIKERYHMPGLNLKKVIKKLNLKWQSQVINVKIAIKIKNVRYIKC